jgi:hypothetical protein
MPMHLSIKKILLLLLVTASAAVSDEWTPASGTLGTIQGIEVIVNHSGDDVINVKFSNRTEHYTVSANNINNDAKFNRLYSILLQIQATGQEVLGVRTSGGTLFKGIRLGVSF